MISSAEVKLFVLVLCRNLFFLVNNQINFHRTKVPESNSRILEKLNMEEITKEKFLGKKLPLKNLLLNEFLGTEQDKIVIQRLNQIG